MADDDFNRVFDLGEGRKIAAEQAELAKKTDEAKVLRAQAEAEEARKSGHIPLYDRIEDVRSGIVDGDYLAELDRKVPWFLKLGEIGPREIVGTVGQLLFGNKNRSSNPLKDFVGVAHGNGAIKTAFDAAQHNVQDNAQKLFGGNGNLPNNNTVAKYGKPKDPHQK